MPSPPSSERDALETVVGRESALSELHHGLAQVGVRLEAVHKLLHVDRPVLSSGGQSKKECE